nr:hypothetical protein [uncultured Oscillibacter sp.]
MIENQLVVVRHAEITQANQLFGHVSSPVSFLERKETKELSRALTAWRRILAEAAATRRGVPCNSSFHRFRFEFPSKFSDTCMITEAT